jgi:hypothetical protein
VLAAAGADTLQAYSGRVGHAVAVSPGPGAGAGAGAGTSAGAGAGDVAKKGGA